MDEDQNLNNDQEISQIDDPVSVIQAEDLSMPPKWFNILLKTASLLIFFVAIFIFTEGLMAISKISHTIEGIIDADFVLSGIVFSLLILLSPVAIIFWGMFKLRKWIIPLLLIGVPFVIFDTLATLFYGMQYGDDIITIVFTVLTSALKIIFVYVVFRHRRYLNGKYKKLVLQASYLIIIIPFFIFNSLSVAFPDDRTIMDEDLGLQEIILTPEKDNAQLLLAQIESGIYASDDIDLYLENNNWDQEKIDLILSRNKTILETMRKAAILPYYQCSYYAEGITVNTLVCPLNFLRDGTKITSLAALSKAKESDFGGAIEDALVPVRIGQLMQDSSRLTVIDYLVANAIKKLGLNTLQIILAEYNIPSDITRPYISELEKYSKNEEGLKNSLKAEYEMGRNSMEALSKIDWNFYFQPKRFLNDMAEHTRRQLLLAGVDCSEINTKLEEHEKYLEKNSWDGHIWKLLFTRNAAGEILKSVVVNNFTALHKKRCEDELLVEQTIIQLVLSAYKYDTGDFLATETDITADYRALLKTSPQE